MPVVAAEIVCKRASGAVYSERNRMVALWVGIGLEGIQRDPQGSLVAFDLAVSHLAVTIRDRRPNAVIYQCSWFARERPPDDFDTLPTKFISVGFFTRCAHIYCYLVPPFWMATKEWHDCFVPAAITGECRFIGPSKGHVSLTTDDSWA